MDAVEAGLPNLIKQIENVRAFGMPVVVAINRFPEDTDSEYEVIMRAALEAGAASAVVHSSACRRRRRWNALAEAVVAACNGTEAIKFTYSSDEPLADKITAVAKKVYGADGVEFDLTAHRSLEMLGRMGYGHLPVCMAKTHLSLSHDPELKGRPSGWILPVRDVRLSAGAGFVYALCGDIMTMPGLPSKPAGENIDIDTEGNVRGLF